jgi:hypothetical protein
LGVDLIYYHHAFDCFTMVQYKRMTGDDPPAYRPNSDGSYAAEVRRMKEFLANGTPGTTSHVEDYRIGQNPFFFKLCPADHEQHWTRMLPGMYIPLDLWERVLKSSRAVGPRGGVSVSYENALRRFNNSEFVRLVRGGWVGSSGRESERISTIIEQELAANKSVVAAIHRERSTVDDKLRDRRGRFASDDDPESF